MKEITNQEMMQLIEVWCEDNSAAPEGMFYAQDDRGVWIGCDNSTRNCWVECFKTRKEVIMWLNGELVCDVNGYLLNDYE